MNKKVTVDQKRDFIKWFLDHEELKHRGAYMILNYLHGHRIVLDKVHFVERADQSPRGMVIAAKSVSQPDFAFYKDGKVFHNPERAFHDMRLNWHHDIYMELQFHQAWLTSPYLTVIEDNPYYSWNDHISDSITDQVDQALDQFLYGYYRDELMAKINDALEINDKQGFLTYTSQLNRMNQVNHYCEDSSWKKQ